MKLVVTCVCVVLFFCAQTTYPPVTPSAKPNTTTVVEITGTSFSYMFKHISVYCILLA